MEWIGVVWEFIVSPGAEAWQAFAAIGTLIVAGAAAIYARGQVKEARRLREEQARPYVAAFLELSDPSTLELVVKNFGATTARNVKMTSDKPMKRYWSDEVEDLRTFDAMPLLVPGQDWRTVFDSHGLRMGKDDDVYTVTISSEDSQGRPLPDERFILDWRTYENRIYVSRRSIHDIGEALVKIERTLKDWSEFPKGLSVVSRSGEKKDERQREWAESVRARHLSKQDEENG